MKILHPLLHAPLADPKQIPTERALQRRSLMSVHVFQTRFGSSTYHNVFVLKLMSQSFVAYESTASPLAFPTCRATNGFLQRELCNVEFQCLIMVLFQFFFSRSFFFLVFFFFLHLVPLNWNWANRWGNVKEG